MRAALEVSNLSKHFGSFTALDHIAFSIPAGCICGVLGPNGAGKTTLFSLIAGFLHANGGSIHIDGQAMLTQRDRFGRVSILPQDARFSDNIPIVDQLIEFRRLDGCDRDSARREVETLLQRVGLGDAVERGLRALSHGMAKRVSIAQAFLGTPHLVLLDEPLAGLDPENAARILDMIHDLRDRNATVCISSHDMRQIQEHCDHILVLDRGRVANCGPMQDLLHGQQQIRLRFHGDSTAAHDKLKNMPMLARVRLERDGDITVFLIDHNASEDVTLRKQFLHACLEADLIPSELRDGGYLEDAYLALTRKK